MPKLYHAPRALSSRFRWRTAGKSYSGRLRLPCARLPAVVRWHDLANSQRYCAPLISSRTNPIRMPMTLLCVHRRSQSRPISTPRLITASALPSAVVRRHDLANPQRYCAPLISSRTNPIDIPAPSARPARAIRVAPPVWCPRPFRHEHAPTARTQKRRRLTRSAAHCACSIHIMSNSWALHHGI